MTNEAPTALEKVKNAITNKITALITAHNEDTSAHGLNKLKNDILTSIQEDGGISGGMDEEQFEAMLDEAIFEETHTTVIIHNSIDGYNTLYWDYEGIDSETGSETGPRIISNEDGDFIIENVSFGTHRIRPCFNNSENPFSIMKNDGEYSEIIIDKDHYKFYANRIDEPQILTQEEI